MHLSAAKLTVLTLMTLALMSANSSANPNPTLDDRQNPDAPELVTASLIADKSSVEPGGAIRLGLRLQHAAGWHTYWRNPGDSGLPTEFNLTGPEGVSVTPIEWPLPSRFILPPLANYGYDGDLLLVRQAQLPGEIGTRNIRFEAQASWLVCREVCLPGKSTVALELPVLDGDSNNASPQKALFETVQNKLSAKRIELSARIADNRLALYLPEELVGINPQRVEYFPFSSGHINQAAPQDLFRHAASQGWRLEIPLANDLDRLDPSLPPSLIDAATGVLVIDERLAFEVGARTESVATNDPRFSDGSLAAIIRGHSVNFSGSSGADQDNGELLAENIGTTGWGLLIAIAFAALGGLILNLMPCVFPVIGLKILGFAGHGTGVDGTLNQSQRRAIRHGCYWFAVGIVLTFLLLAGAMLTMQAAGQAVGWGFQLQSPPFVAAMALLFAAIGMNFSGLFEFGASLTRLGNLDRNLVDDNPAGDNHVALPWPALGSGALAVLVATPCTAPFMGSALGYTMTQSTAVTLLVFASLGIGMASPYAVLGLKPGWLRLLPRPGRWMESLRQAMAFPMYGAAIWLVWVLGKQSGVDAMLALLAGVVTLGFGLWIWGRFGQTATNRMRRTVYGLSTVALIVLAIGLSWRHTDPAPLGQQTVRVGHLDWQPWSRPGLEQLVASGKPVFVDFTAAWCISCQVNKKTTLESAAVRAAFEEKGITLMRADWTRHDAAITVELARHSRNGVPLYLMYKPGSTQPEILPALLTPALIIEAISASSS